MRATFLAQSMPPPGARRARARAAGASRKACPTPWRKTGGRWPLCARRCKARGGMPGVGGRLFFKPLCACACARARACAGRRRPAPCRVRPGAPFAQPAARGRAGPAGRGQPAPLSTPQPGQSTKGISACFFCGAARRARPLPPLKNKKPMAAMFGLPWAFCVYGPFCGTAPHQNSSFAKPEKFHKKALAFILCV